MFFNNKLKVSRTDPVIIHQMFSEAVPGETFVATLCLILGVISAIYSCFKPITSHIMFFLLLGLFGFISLIVLKNSQKLDVKQFLIFNSFYTGLPVVLISIDGFITTKPIRSVFGYSVILATILIISNVETLTHILTTLLFLATISHNLVKLNEIPMLVCTIFVCLLIMVLAYYRYLYLYDNVKLRHDIEDINNNLEATVEAKDVELKQELSRLITLQDDMINGMAQIIENRDADTGNHVIRTSRYVNLICKELQHNPDYADMLSARIVKVITQAAPLHDVGKITIPDAILCAPRCLTDEEFAIMKTHTVEGEKIIRNVYKHIDTKGFLEIACNIARYHHERWDGRGYPDNLKGGEIPLEARIMSVADVFDALVSRRCYKDEMSISEAFEEIVRNKGTQFDPDVVDAFCNIRSDIIDTVVCMQ